MFKHLGNFVAKHWMLVILFWLALMATARVVAPSWDSVTQDGDFAYLPDRCRSVIGQKLMDQAFPETSGKSQVVVGIVRNGGQPGMTDLIVAFEVAARFHNLFGASLLVNQTAPATLEQRMSGVTDNGETASADDSGTSDAENEPLDLQQRSALMALVEFDRAIELDQRVLEFLDGQDPSAELDEAIAVVERQLAMSFFNRSIANYALANDDEAKSDFEFAIELDSNLSEVPRTPLPEISAQCPATDFWTWQTEVVGSKLIELKDKLAWARLGILHLSTEFMAVENIALFEWVQSELDATQEWAEYFDDPDIEVVVTGSAAVGSDLLLASKESLEYTELFALVLVVLILVFVYRSPLLICVPLISIIVSLSVAISLLAALTQLHLVPGFGWWDFKVFKTTRIFIVVILYGAGTDYCLFLISRFREEATRGKGLHEAVALALSNVGNALSASALTTILGLGMMFFAEFGKLKNSGPAIAVSLSVTLLVCVTLAPASLCLFGRLFVRKQAARETSKQDSASSKTRFDPARWLWTGVADVVTRYPGAVLVISFSVLTPLAIQGIQSAGNVTYDLLSGLEPQRPSRYGTDVLSQHFPVGESGPIVVLAEGKHERFLTDDGKINYEMRDEIESLSQELAGIDGVQMVRSLSRPLGDEPEGIVAESIRSIAYIRHTYVTQVPELNHRVTRIDVVTEYDVFSDEANSIFHQITDRLDELRTREDSKWSHVNFSFAGTTAAMSDLREITESDNRRIEILVAVAVFLVLVFIIRRPLICLYMVFTVLVSFSVTIAITDWTFSWAYGESYTGLDWKVPLFLYVILVAVGEDYNVYLATRVFEEQAKRGPIEGLRYAVICTGGIITSCGLIMAGTFISMTSGTWFAILPESLPLIGVIATPVAGTLRSLVELGFALALGVMLDTFIVRPVLLPAFFALLCRIQGRV